MGRAEKGGQIMATFEIQDPSGRVHRVEAPDNATRDQIIALAQRGVAQQEQLAADRKTYSPTAGMSGLERFAAGAGQPVDALLRGVKQRGAELLNKVGLVSDDTVSQMQAEEADRRRTDQPLLSTGAGKVGQIAGSIGMIAPTAFIPGANTYAGSMAVGALAGGAAPTIESESAIQNAALGGGAGALGKAVGDKVASAIARRYGAKFMRTADMRQANAPRDAILAEARKAGYVVPPTTVNPSATNRVLESFAGKINTAQQSSIDNQAITNALARKAIGVADDAPLTDVTFRKVITEANKAYDALKGLKTINWTPEYVKNIKGLAQQTPGSVVKNPAADQIDDLIKQLDRPSFTGKEIVSTIRQLRRESSLAFKAGQAANDEAKLAIAQAKRSAADALEGLAEQALQNRNMPNLVEPFRAARVRLAKLANVEQAASETGDVSAQKLARLLAKGAPLTDDLRTIATTAQAFEKAFQDPSKIGSPVVSNLRAAAVPAMSLLGYGTMGPVGTLLAAAPLASPATRSILLSKPYQALMANPQYADPKLLALAHRLMQAEATRRAIPGAAAMGALAMSPAE